MNRTNCEQTLPNTPWQQEATLIRQSGEVIHAMGESMLQNGLSVLLDQPVFTGEYLRLESLLPECTDQYPEQLRMYCRVAYLVALTHPANRMRAGLSIEFIDAVNRQRLLRFAQQQIHRRRLRRETATVDAHQLTDAVQGLLH